MPIDFVPIPEPQTPEYPEQIKMIMPGEPASGGYGSPENAQAEGLAKRTQWLKANMAPLSAIAEAAGGVKSLIAYDPDTNTFFGVPLSDILFDVGFTSIAVGEAEIASAEGFSGIKVGDVVIPTPGGISSIKVGNVTVSAI